MPPVQPTPLIPVKTILRTPDHRFENLPGYNFKPNYIESRAHAIVRIHYLDEGPKTARETMLLMHGEPSWCYLYRRMIPIFVEAGFRVICPDLVGFGRSDKPGSKGDYTYERMVDWMSEIVTQLDLRDITFFGQDWGGMIGLRIISRYPERFSRIVIANTDLPTGRYENLAASNYFLLWQKKISQETMNWASLFKKSLKRGTKEECDAYEAPFPSESYKTATRAMPWRVALTPDGYSVEENKGAIRRIFKNWTKPFLTTFSDKDVVTSPKIGEYWQRLVPGAKGVKHTVIKDAGHFLQDDKGEELAEVIVDFVRSHPVPRAVVARARL